ncbi:MAG: DUF3429 domain-containing protein [Rhodospirillales bacterium]|jgi:hypothetical protein
MSAFSLNLVPRPALWLGFGGLLPFYGCVFALWKGDAEAAATAVLLNYAAAILSFLGAVHWGRALADPAQQNWNVLGWSVAPALLGWLAATWMEAAPALILLIVGFWAAFAVDLRAAAEGRFPLWYLALRRALSALVVLALALALTAVW